MFDLVNFKKICDIQKKKLIFYTILVVIVSIGFLIVNITIVARSLYIKDQFEKKKNSVSSKSIQVANIEKAIRSINNFKIDNDLKRKNGIYSTFNKQDFIDAIIKKMDLEDDLDKIDNNENFEYFKLKFYFSSLGNANLEKKINNIRKNVEVLENQGLDIRYDGNLVRVSFFADYEYVIYKVWSMIKQIFPGYIVIRKFNIKPEREEIKTLLYRRKIYNSKEYMNVDNRLQCEIEFDWIMLSSNTINNNSISIG